ncbi:hypothetical protein BJ742DRAFT_16802 [Cladochytrium replicatum]|nr:hypothetical protein BJ742DRAFT_16802 [Cladochytrium replicatum]
MELDANGDPSLSGELPPSYVGSSYDENTEQQSTFDAPATVIDATEEIPNYTRPELPREVVSIARGPPPPEGIRRLIVVELSQNTFGVYTVNTGIMYEAKIFNKAGVWGRNAAHVYQLTVTRGNEFTASTLFQSKSQHSFHLTDPDRAVPVATIEQKSTSLVGPPKFVCRTRKSQL